MNVAVLGGGAAGFFAAISCKTHHPKADVTIYERSGKLLSKVKVSGGGRCNVTNACYSNSLLSKSYPRGERWLRKAYSQFSVNDTIAWFESKGVKLKTEPDNRMFPVTNNSQTIIDCLVAEAQQLGIKIRMNCSIKSIENSKGGFKLVTESGDPVHANKIIVATGGSPKMEGFNWLAQLNSAEGRPPKDGLAGARILQHTIEPPVPSLFTFNIPGNPITELMGISVEHAAVKIQSTKLKQEGPLLVTHWGLSGPSVLKLSAFGARALNEMNYHFKINVNWCGKMNEEEVRSMIAKEFNQQSKIKNQQFHFRIPSRLWLYLLSKCEINPESKWGDLKKDKQNKLIAALTSDEYEVKGKTTFKEEFVTCGGVSLKDVSFNTMESNVCPGIYFAGEVLDIDGITGGFNFQAAWTTGFIAGKLGGK